MNETWEYGDGGETPDHPGFPWPPAANQPVLPAFGETWRRASFSPATLFDRIPRSGGTGAAIIFYLALVVLVAGAGLFWDSLSLFTGRLQEDSWEAQLGMDAVSPLVTFLLAPAILLAFLWIGAGASHLLLLVLGGARHGFGTTLRVFCYAYSPGIFGIIPLIGGLIGSVWMLVVLIVGLREAHETAGWKPAVAVLLPFFLLFGLMLVVFLMFIATGAALLTWT